VDSARLNADQRKEVIVRLLQFYSDNNFYDNSAALVLFYAIKTDPLLKNELIKKKKCAHWYARMMSKYSGKEITGL
jgi:hypothetical protein